MKKIIKNNSSSQALLRKIWAGKGNFLIILLIFLTVGAWIFSGWPQIWQNPRIPPKVEEAIAAQFGRPNNTVSAGSWTAVAAATLHEATDEVIANDDTDYAVATINTTAEIGLSGLTDPETNSGHIVRFRFKPAGSGAPERLVADLYQGTTLIRSSGNITGARGQYNDASFVLTATEADSITNYSDLRLRIRTTNLTAGESMRVTWLEFEVPDALVTPPATWKAAEDTAIIDVNKNKNIRLRIEIANSGSEATDYDYRLEYATKLGSICGDDESFSAVPVTATNEPFEMTNSPYVTNGEPTTPKLTVPPCCPTFIPGKIVEYPSNSSGYITLPYENYTDIEFVFQTTVNAIDGGSYCFRLTNTGIPLEDYSIYPELQIVP